MKLLLLCVVLSCCIAASARADTLTWTNPTTRTNPAIPFDAATEQGGVHVIKNGANVATVAGAGTTWNSGSGSCTPINWQVSVFDKTLPPVGPLESALSVAVLGPIDTVGCAPKSPGNVKAGS